MTGIDWRSGDGAQMIIRVRVDGRESQATGQQLWCVDREGTGRSGILPPVSNTDRPFETTSCTP
jgi:hypothetical protein